MKDDLKLAHEQLERLGEEFQQAERAGEEASAMVEEDEKRLAELEMIFDVLQLAGFTLVYENDHLVGFKHASCIYKPYPEELEAYYESRKEQK